MTDYIVHSRHDTEVHVKAKTEAGIEVRGIMPAAIVELVPVDGVGPSLTLHEHAPTEEDFEKIKATFPEGGIVRSSGFTLIKPPEKKKKKPAAPAEEAAQ